MGYHSARLPKGNNVDVELKSEVETAISILKAIHLNHLNGLLVMYITNKKVKRGELYV